MAVIHKGQEKYSAENPVFYEDEVGIHLNPKIGADWQARAQQKRVVTPGQNEGRRYTRQSPVIINAAPCGNY
ncbi:hypothetical protein YERSI8AC_10157 [Enterobacterales bacterium 8AC]|nr:hypothetical protein YERSI8AC_10157 [Enterobacterales bacterium 8AC]